MAYDAGANLDLCRSFGAEPRIDERRRPHQRLAAGEKAPRLKLCLIVEKLPHADCMLVVPPGSPGNSGDPSYDAKAHIWNHSQ